jgi:hypothetical protein
MSNPVSPSPIIECYLRNFKDFLPDDQKAKLATHDDAIAATTSEGDEGRALHCAVWAIKASNEKSASHPRWKEIKESHQIWKDTWFGAEFGLMMPQSSIGDDVRVQWTESAAEVVRTLAEDDGWGTSHWEDLLVELIDRKH